MQRERKPVWVELLQGFLVGTRIRVSECFVSVAIMWIIIDNCKIYTHESKANMQTSRLVVMPRIGSVEWLVSAEIYEGTVSKKYFTQIVKQREWHILWYTLKSSAYAVLDPVTLSFECGVDFDHHIPTLFHHISSFTNVKYIAHLSLTLFECHEPESTRRQDRHGMKTENRNEWKKINIFYILCDLCRLESIPKLCDCVCAHFLYYNALLLAFGLILYSFFHRARYDVHLVCSQWVRSRARIRPFAIEWATYRCRVEWERVTKRVREKIEPETHTLLHFALKLHNHKSQEMNIIQMSSDEILMYVMSYIRSECERGLFFSPLIFSDTLSSSIVCLSAIEFGYSVEYLCAVWPYTLHTPVGGNEPTINDKRRWRERRRREKNEMNVLRMHIYGRFAIYFHFHLNRHVIY